MSHEQRHERYFSQTEAEEKVGRQVQTLVEFSGVPEGATGLVISADSAGLVKQPDRAVKRIYDVAIQWDAQTALANLAKRMEKSDENENTVECNQQRDQLLEEQDELLFLQSHQPLVDWFRKDEYERYLVELPGENNPTKS